MPTFPTTVIPSMVSAPELIDPMHEYNPDQGYSVRRAKHSRPRRRWTVTYLGKHTDEMRQIRDFLLQQRLGTLDFQWFHPTAMDSANAVPTTPVTLGYRHGLYTGMWVGVNNAATVPSISNQLWQITRVNEITVTLNGSVGSGIAGFCEVQVFVPHARAVMREETYESPATLIGPEAIHVAQRAGYFNFSVQIEELF